VKRARRRPLRRADRAPRLFWPRALPTVARHVAKTMPWATLFAGCLAGLCLLAVLAHVAASHAPLDQNKVRLAFLIAVVALAFVPHAPSGHPKPPLYPRG
jgi:hypothetical protein